MDKENKQKITKACEIRLSNVLKANNSSFSEMSSEINKRIFYRAEGRSLRDRTQLKKPGRFENEFLSKKVRILSDSEEETQEYSGNAKITDFFTVTPKKKKMKKNRPINSESESPNSSHNSDIENVNVQDKNEYAEMVEKNIKDKMDFLRSLNLPQVKQELVESVQVKKPQSKGISVKNLKDKVETPLPQRTSKRLLKLEPDGKPLVEEPKLKTYQYPYSNDVYKSYTPRLSVANPLGLKQTCPTQADAVETFLSGLSTDLTPHLHDDVLYNRETMETMVNKEELIAKVVPDRIYSMAIHPRVTRRLLVAAGGKTGYLGIWDVGSSEGQDGVFLFRPCHDSINCLSFEPESLVCCSYEGTLKRFDLQQGEFHHLYATPDNLITRCTHFDSVSEHCYLVSISDGCVMTVDTRTPGIKEEKCLECHEKPIKTVSVHPLKKDYFLTAANDGTVRLWDLRCFKDLKPVAEVSQKRSVNCGYFSPLTGNSFVTLSYDDTVRVYDSSSLGTDLKQISSIRHDNQVGRWVTPFRAQWVPNQEKVFAIGSKNYPRDIGVYNASNGRKEHSFTSDYLGSIVPIITFHPKLPCVAGGNASGKVFLFSSNTGN